MPNHVTNILRIVGPEDRVAQIKSEISSVWEDTPDEPRPIDFDKIVERPESLNITCGSTTDNGIAILKYRDGDPTEINRIMGYAWGKGFNSPDDLINHLIEKGSANLEDAQKALDNEKLYGHRDWYSWSRDAWGTKWNAYSQEVRENGDIKFETAWSTPEPVFVALSRKYPDVEIQVRYADEDFGHNVGEFTYKNGDVVSENIPDGGSEDAYEMAADIMDDWEYIKDRCMEIEAETISELEEYELKMIKLLLNKEIIDEYPTVVLEYMEQLAVEEENYEMAQIIKDTTPIDSDEEGPFEGPTEGPWTA
jgi:hypothetical protein